MKKQLLQLLLIFTCSIAAAQQLNNDYTKLFARSGSSSEPIITTDKDGNIAILRDTLIYKVDVNTGDSIGASVGFGSTFDQPKAIVRSGDHYYVTGSIRKQGVSGQITAVAKYTMSMDTVWRRELSGPAYGNLGYAIHVNGNGIYVAGQASGNKLFFAHLSDNGDTSYVKTLSQTTFCNLTDIIETSDGAYLVTGHLDDYPLAYKFRSNGDTLWSYYEPTFISFTKAVAFEKSASEYVMVARNRFIFLNATTGAKQKESAGLIDYFDLQLSADTVFLFGTHKTQTYGGNQLPLVEARNLNLDSLKSWTYSNNVHPTANNKYTSGVMLNGNQFACTGLVRDSINLSANQWNIAVSKFNDGSGTTSIKSRDSSSGLLAYPNPAQGTLFFSESIDEVQIFDLNGALISTTVPNGNTLPLEGIKAGIYIIETRQSSEVNQFKIIIR